MSLHRRSMSSMSAWRADMMRLVITACITFSGSSARLYSSPMNFMLPSMRYLILYSASSRSASGSAAICAAFADGLLFGFWNSSWHLRSSTRRKLIVVFLPAAAASSSPPPPPPPTSNSGSSGPILEHSTAYMVLNLGSSSALSNTSVITSRSMSPSVIGISPICAAIASNFSNVSLLSRPFTLRISAGRDVGSSSATGRCHAFSDRLSGSTGAPFDITFGSSS
mmetsp:Transcript_12832/g.31724  ORF Transcript_12832/g.31724 Transcript_12832/m.31724 type:complete len:224 (+) Transcript_12832:317-988(+)